MKNRKFFKKLIAVLLLGIGATTICACQTSDTTQAKIDENVSTCKIEYVTDPVTLQTKKICKVYLSFVNPTIYNCTAYKATIVAYDAKGQVIGDPYTNEENVYVPHGCTLGVAYQVEIKNQEVVDFKLVPGSAVGTKFQNVWESYLGWWIATIILVAIALIAHCARIFTTKDENEIVESFKETIAMQLVVLALVAIICIVPLIFSSWVVTCILAGGYLAFLAVAGLTTFLRVKAVK